MERHLLVYDLFFYFYSNVRAYFPTKVVRVIGPEKYRYPFYLLIQNILVVQKKGYQFFEFCVSKKKTKQNWSDASDYDLNYLDYGLQQ